MGNKIAMFSVLIFCFCIAVYGANEEVSNSTHSTFPSTEAELEVYRQKLRNQTKAFEKGVRTFLRDTVKKLLPSLMSYNDNSPMSSKCMSSLMKYISGLTSVKVWAIRMLDATSKPPSGVFEGTLNDFGGFDQCLKIEVPDRKGNVEFRGRYCAIEARPFLPPPPNNFSLAKVVYAKPLDTLAEEVYLSGMVFHYLKFRFGVCIPSSCTLQDMQSVAKLASSKINMNVEIPQCYVKEKTVFEPIHIAVILVLSLLFLACLFGSVVEYNSKTTDSKEWNFSKFQRVMVCFSFISNYRRLISASQGSEELKALHGLKALSIAYVILGHTYVWINFQLLRSPNQSSVWFNQIDFGAILNGWMGVEIFFILSGLLTSYTVMKIMLKTKGRLNIPLYIIRRYLRLTPGLLLVMGLLYFLPLLSSGPFWYERVDPEIRSCNKYWWRGILYISNWYGIQNICVHPTWYLSADFQLHIIAAVFLIILYRCPKLGLSLIASFVLACTAMIGALTYHWELPPIILISSGNDDQIQRTIDDVHFNTMTHAGPYFVGIVLGYIIYKYKDIQLNKTNVACGWILSIVLSLTSMYGGHRWNIGEGHGPLLTAIYAALHRTTYSIGVAWVVFACVTGYGGIVNRLLSSAILAPVSRLTYTIYLMHSLVIWTRIGSRRERVFESHYNLLYEYAGNLVTSVLITIPFYLLLESPLSNLERLAFSGRKNVEDSSKESKHLPTNLRHFAGKTSAIEENHTIVPVELRSVKQVENGCHNLGFHGDLNNYKSQ